MPDLLLFVVSIVGLVFFFMQQNMLPILSRNFS